MAINQLNNGFDIYLIRNFFDAQTSRKLIDELRRCPTVPAKIYGQGESSSVNVTARKSDLLMPSRETVEIITKRLANYREEIGKHFGANLESCEEPQFLRYRAGDFFVAHQDGNTALLRSEREQRRKISVVIFVNDQSETPENDSYCGGSLVFSDWRANREFRLSGEAGMLVGFRSETTHEVIPVTDGERYSIAGWFGHTTK